MNVNGTKRIAAPRARVWEALRDPAVLAACLPGCEDLVQVAPGEYRGWMAGKVGTVASRFECRAAVSGETFPAVWTVTAHAYSATAGWIDGAATVTLAEEGEGTILGYRARVEAGGRLTTLGEGLLHAAAIRLAQHFLDALTGRLDVRPPAAARRDMPPPAAGPRVPPPAVGPPMVPEPAETPAEARRKTAVLVVGTVIWLMVLLLVFAVGGGH